jgi:hemerythrin-like domain-containing protein
MIHINENIADETLLLNLVQTIDNHIRFEERQLFPYAEKIIPEEELNLIYEQLAKDPAKCENWEIEFWVKPK